MSKIVLYKDLHSFSQKVVLVGGCFDLLHIGHIDFLKRAKKEGELLAVALESDQFIKKNKKQIPFHNQKERAEILSSLSMVDLVILLPYFKDSKQYGDLVEKIKPSIIAITVGDPFKKEKEEQGKQVGALVKEVIPLLHNKSSTLLRKFIRNTHKDVQ